MTNEQEQLAKDIIKLRNELLKTSNKILSDKLEVNNGSYCAFKLTCMVLSGYLGAMFTELTTLGNMVKHQEGNEFYLDKVIKFENAVKLLSNEMSDVEECFKKSAVH